MIFQNEKSQNIHCQISSYMLNFTLSHIETPKISTYNTNHNKNVQLHFRKSNFHKNLYTSKFRSSFESSFFVCFYCSPLAGVKF